MANGTNDLAASFRSARNVSTPGMLITTADPAAVVQGLLPTIADKGGAPLPAMQWDGVRGLRGLNPKGAAVVQALVGAQGSKEDAERQIAEATQMPDDALRLLARAEKGSVVFMQNGNRYWDAPAVAQAMWNLRDPYKSTQRALVVLAPDGTRIPRELANDFITFSDPLPGRPELQAILEKLHKAAGLAMPAQARLEKAIDAASGLSAFAADQIIAMALRSSGVDVAAIRARRRTSIENTVGLSIYDGDDTFETLGGLEHIKTFARLVRDRSREPIKAIAFLDEIDKIMGGMGTAGGPGDSSGVSQYQLRALLTGIQDTGAKGMFLYGVQGCGKTAFAGAFANELGVELLQVDLGRMQAGIVGESQQNTAAAMKVIDAVGQGHTLYIATANGLGQIPLELRRRLRTFGEWFFDVADDAERKAIVDIYLKKWNLKPTPSNPLPDMTDWTGAEVRSCFYLAYDLNLSFVEAADFIVPLAVSSRDEVKRIRMNAAGKFRSASTPGYYQMPGLAELPEGVRQFAGLEDAVLGTAAVIATAGKKGN